MSGFNVRRISTVSIVVPQTRGREWHGVSAVVGVLARLTRNQLALVALGFLLAVVVVALGAPVLAPYQPLQVRPNLVMAEPSAQHWLGTDQLGRDVFTRILYGGQLTLQVAFVSVLMSALIGVAFGLLAGYRGGTSDELIMRAVDVLLAFPGILLALAMVAFLQPGLTSVITAVGISGIPHFARVTRARALSVKREPYIEAARVSGCSVPRIVLRHILPNVAAPILVLMTLGASTAILTEASLSFLGLGVQPPAPEWGAMMNAGRDFLRQAPWLINGPGVVLMLTVLAINTLGDGLRDALDPA